MGNKVRGPNVRHDWVSDVKRNGNYCDIKLREFLRLHIKAVIRVSQTFFTNFEKRTKIVTRKKPVYSQKTFVEHVSTSSYLEILC